MTGFANKLLEARGWTFVRIWSTDYFRDPEGQIDRVLLAYEGAIKSKPVRRASRPERQPNPVGQTSRRNAAAAPVCPLDWPSVSTPTSSSTRW